MRLDHGPQRQLLQVPELREHERLQLNVMRVTTLADKLFFSTAFLEAQSVEGGSWTGTGFVYGFDDDRGRVPFLVTNKHIVCGASALTIRLVTSQPGDEAVWGSRRKSPSAASLATPNGGLVTRETMSTWLSYPLRR
jgi:hypothetical protein